VRKAQREQRPRLSDERIEEWRDRKKQRTQHHHALAPEHVGERPRRQLEENAGDRRGGDDDPDELGRDAKIGGKRGEHRAARRLVAEAR
jgi:hypothetical protein